MNIATKIALKIKFAYSAYKNLIHKKSPPLRYRVLHIEKDRQSNYIAVVQLISKNKTFSMKPEEILADDEMTDCFSQRDIRTLTYLGYLGINSPKYKILAKRLSESNNQLVFAIQEKGNKKTIVKSANEISTNKEFLQGFDQLDAHMVGYTTATERTSIENIEKKQLLKALREEKKNNFPKLKNKDLKGI